MGVGDLLLLVTSTALSLALLELLLRLFFPIYPSAYQPDDLVLMKTVPGARRVLTRLPINGGQRIVSEFNSDGFRGEPLRPLDHLQRLIVYGDSNVEAEFSELAATFPKQLESRLERELAVDLQVLNAGVIGYGPDQVSLRLGAELQKFKPTLVVVVIFADNDFGDLIRNRIYRLGSRGELQLNNYRLSPDLRERMQNAAYPRGLRRLQLSRYADRLWGMARESWTHAQANERRHFAAPYIERTLALNQQTFHDYVIVNSDTGYSADPLFDYYDADIALEPDSSSARYKTELMEQVVIKLRDTAEQAHTGLILVVLPSAIDVCEHYDIEIDTRRYPQYDRARLSRLVEDIAVRNHIPLLNLWHAFRAVDANRFYFHGGDHHWNDAGQAEAARLTASMIEQLKLLRTP